MLALLVAARLAAGVGEAGHGFDWTAAGIGAAAGFGLALALVGSIALLRSGRR